MSGRIDIGLKVPTDATGLSSYLKNNELYSQMRDIMAAGVMDATSEPSAAKIKDLYGFDVNVLLAFFFEDGADAAEEDTKELVKLLTDRLDISGAVLSADRMESWELLMH